MEPVYNQVRVNYGQEHYFVEDVESVEQYGARLFEVDVDPDRVLSEQAKHIGDMHLEQFRKTYKDFSVFPSFNIRDHVVPVDELPVDNSWDLYLSGKVGFVNPACYQLWAVSPGKDVFVMLKEMYHTCLSIDQQLAILFDCVICGKTLSSFFSARSIMHEYRLRFEKAGLSPVLYMNEQGLEADIKRINSLLESPGSIMFAKDALVHKPDVALATEASRTIDSFFAYTYGENMRTPISKDDAGVHVARYVLCSVGV